MMKVRERNAVGSETVTISKEEYESLKKANEELSKQVAVLMQQIALARKQRFGSSSEQSKCDSNCEQLSFLFNEAEAYADSSSKAEEPDLTTVKEHKRKRHLTRSDNLPEDIETEIQERILSGDDLLCPQCGEQMKDIGRDVIRRLKVVPAKFVIVETHIHRYACESCQKNGTSTPVVSAKADPAVVPGGCATPEAVAYLATEKFVMHSPLYRMEQHFKLAGIPLSRQTMSNWLLKSSKLWLEPLWQQMKIQLLKEEVLHADETTLQVLNEPDRKATSKSYMWLYRTGKAARQQLVLYDYQETRSATHPAEFLQGYKGYLHTDGYAGYHKLPDGIRVVGCHAHARRKFDEALKVLPEADRKDSAALRGVRYFDTLFAIEEKLADLSPDERKEKRGELAGPVLNELYNWVFRLNAAPKSLLGKAAHYVREQWVWLVRYLEDGRLEISNNRAERSIKPFVMSRKNFLFANTPSGAKGSAVYFSLIETAKENGLDPYRYLTWVLRAAPTVDLEDETMVASLLPVNAPMECKADAATSQN